MSIHYFVSHFYFFRMNCLYNCFVYFFNYFIFITWNQACLYYKGDFICCFEFLVIPFFEFLLIIFFIIFMILQILYARYFNLLFYRNNFFLLIDLIIFISLLNSCIEFIFSSQFLCLKVLNFGFIFNSHRHFHLIYSLFNEYCYKYNQLIIHIILLLFLLLKVHYFMKILVIN